MPYVRAVLALLALLAALASLFSFFWWVVYAAYFISPSGIADTRRDILEAWRNGSVLRLSYELRYCLFVLGGAYGWVALVALCVLSQRHWSAVPTWVKVGCGVGALSGLSFPLGHLMAVPPVTCAVALLVRTGLTARSSGPPSASAELKR